MNKIVIYDIDYTVISVNAIIYFYIYLLTKKPLRILYLPVVFVFFILFVLRIISLDYFKSITLIPFKGINKNKIDEYSRSFFNNFLKDKIKKGVKENIDEYKKSDFIILFATASYENYIKYLAEYFDADFYFGTKILYNNNRLFPKLDGKNCKGNEKIRRILDCIPEKNIIKEKSFGYSDGNTDLPYLELVDTFYKVSRKKWKIVKTIKNEGNNFYKFKKVNKE